MKDSFTLVEAYDSSNSQAIFDHYNQTEDADARMAFEIYFLHQRIRLLQEKFNSPSKLLFQLTRAKVDFDIENDGHKLLDLLWNAVQNTYQRMDGMTAYADIPEVESLRHKIGELEDDIAAARNAIDEALDADSEIQKERAADAAIEYHKERLAA
ncbi:hypothetical protein [Candidiatus Paracoxiella cheracis]|uniref:hypothetical protein n=1 Tax=Candidiatus Paracoxiella cheracis TaxID=3405120 RepID=UPI003BF4A6A3